MDYQAAIKEIPQCIVYFKWLVIPNYGALFEVSPGIRKEIMAANPGLKLAEPPYCFNVYLDGEYKDRDIAVEICEAVNRVGKSVNGIEFRELAATSAVAVMHKGSYQDLGKAYSFIFRWIEENNYQIAGDPRESYIDGCWSGTAKADWLTEIQVPVAKA